MTKRKITPIPESGPITYNCTGVISVPVIKRIVVTGDRFTLRDTRQSGLLLRIGASGKKTWALDYRSPNGTRRTHPIGTTQTLSIKELDYVMAARSIDASPARIMLRHILPNVAATYIVLSTITLGFAIVVEASLSFLGVGIPPDVPTWGGMLTLGASRYIHTAPWLAIFPGLAITLVVFAINLLGDSLRDVLDPRLRGGI